MTLSRVSKIAKLVVPAWAVTTAIVLLVAWRTEPEAALRGEPRAPALAPKPDGERIQLAILLDTSSSMNGLIDQARSQLWRIVNQLGSARRDGKLPRLEIALYEYGNSSLPADRGYIRQVLPFTGDLDRVSEELFALQTGGGDEFCGQVIAGATADLAWAEGALKLMYVAGNEPFTQGPVDYRKAIAAARERGITIDTIYCGDAKTGIVGGWRAGAVLAQGTYLTIDQNRTVAHVAAPQDAEIARLGGLLNETYLAYGSAGLASVARQAAQDSNAAKHGPGSTVARSVSKANPYYDNSAWDLVDARRRGKLDWKKVPEAELPEALRGKSPEEREAFVKAQADRRAELQRRINELEKDRQRHVAARAAGAAPDTLDRAIIATVRAHAEKRGFRFE